MPLTDHQKKIREGRITASLVPDILGCGWGTPLDAYHLIRGEVEPAEENDAMRFGTMIEPVLIQWAAEEHGLSGFRRNQTRVAKGGHLAATFDALGSDYAIEAKSSGIHNPRAELEDWGPDGSDEVPDRVLVQIVAQWLCAPQVAATLVPALLGRGIGVRMYIIRRDEELCDIVDERLRKFSEWCDAGRAPPDSLSYESIKRIKRVEGAVAEVPTDVWLDAYESRQRRLNAEKDEKAAFERLMGMAGTAEIIRCEAGELKYGQRSRTAVDQKALAAAHPEIVESFKRTTTFRAATWRPNKEVVLDD